MTNETDSFVQEVDENLRQERMMALLKRYGPWLLGAFAVFLVVLGGWQLWTGYQTNQARTQSEDYIAALELVRAGNFEDANAALEQITNEGTNAYRTMATMEQAAIAVHQGDLEAALAKFDEAADLANDPVMRESAQMRAAYIAADTQDFEALRARLQPLIDDGGNMSFLARELLGIEAWEAGDADLARSTMEDLTLALNAPEVVRNRAQVALAVIGPAAPAASDASAETPEPSEGESK